jgi:hypothetical protein
MTRRQQIVQQLLAAIKKTNQLNQLKKKKHVQPLLTLPKKYYLSNIYNESPNNREK